VSADGTLNWEFSAGTTNYVAPIIGADGIVYTGWEDGNIYAIDPTNITDKVHWSTNLGDAIQNGLAIGGNGSLIAVTANGMVYALWP